MTTIDTSKAPKWFPDETPEERVYWRAGVIRAVPDASGSLTVYDCERAAWKDRETYLKFEEYAKTHDAPYPVTRDEASAQALRDYGFRRVTVYDEQGNVVEEWTV